MHSSKVWNARHINWKSIHYFRHNRIKKKVNFSLCISFLFIEKHCAFDHICMEKARYKFLIIIITWTEVMFCIFPTAENVYAFQVFTPEFCQEFIEEINHFENTELPKGRPNTMNNYGVCRSVFIKSIINMIVLRFSKSELRRRQCLFDKKQHSCNW